MTARFRDLKYAPVPHDQAAFLAKARALAGFSEAYDALALEYQLVSQRLRELQRPKTGVTPITDQVNE
jgi:hypothetical protein